MPPKQSYRLALIVALPILISSISMVFGFSRVLNGIAESVNSHEKDRAWQAVQSAVTSSKNRLAGVVADNAYWNDPIPRVYGKFDAEWVEEMWGASSGDINYDAVMISTSDGETLAAYATGQATPVTVARLMGKQLEPILDSLTKSERTFKTVSTLVDTPFGLAIVAAGPILPTDLDIELPTPRPHILIYIKFLTPKVLAQLGAEYAVDNLRIQPFAAGTKTGLFTLVDAWGAPVATAEWQPRQPGNAAKASYIWVAIALIFSLLVAMLPISFIHFKTLQRLKAKESEAKAEARKDPLSGLPNRLFLTEALTAGLETAHTDELALLFIDLDGFKAVNDIFGHETGDLLLVAFASSVSGLNESDTVFARLGGDEFAILISGQNAERRSKYLAELINAAVHKPFNLAGKIASIGASIGIAVLGKEPVAPAEFMRRADAAMYESKSGGRNGWRVFDLELDTLKAEEFQIAVEMRDLIERSAFEVAYQPIVASKDRSILGVEALARWPRTSLRKIQPSQFIHIAEQHGLIDALGAHILDMACRDIADWQEMKLSVNVSPMQFSNQNLVPEIKRIAAGRGLPLSRLEVELTEAVVIRDVQKAKRVIADLHEAGIKVALDDFGTGYASIGYLREFCFDKIKIDRTLTQSAFTSVESQNIVQGTILIAKGLSAEILAEGVESEEEAKIMYLAGCGLMQGYYFGMPQTIEALKNRVATPSLNDQSHY